MSDRKPKEIESIRDAALKRALNTPHKLHKPLKTAKKGNKPKK